MATTLSKRSALTAFKDILETGTLPTEAEANNLLAWIYKEFEQLEKHNKSTARDFSDVKALVLGVLNQNPNRYHTAYEIMVASPEIATKVEMSKIRLGHILRDMESQGTVTVTRPTKSSDPTLYHLT